MIAPTHSTGLAHSSGTRAWTIAAIAGAHLALVVALQHGMLGHAVKIVPKELVVSLVSHNEVRPPAPPPRLPEPKLPPLAQPYIAPVETSIPAPSQSVIAHSTTIAPAPQPSHVEPASEAPAPTMQVPKVVSAVEYLQAPRADYPALSRRMGEEGKVVMSVLVNELGRAEKVEVQKSSGSARLDEAARLALLRAVFKPYVENGRCQTVLAIATINFSLSS